MKIRKMVKKTMAAGMLALMACTSMSAMAEKQWVRVSNLYYKVNGEVYEASSWEEICQGYAEKKYVPGTGVCIDYNTNCHQFAGSVLSYSGGSLVCSSFQTGDKKYSVNTTFCPQGQKRVEGVNGLGSFGCYEYIDCDPSLYTRGVVPEACKPKEEPCTGVDFNTMTPTPPGCVPVNVPECETTQNNATSRDLKAATGFILCESDDICAIPDRDIEDSEAREYARSCTYVHEYHHLMDAKTEQGKEYRDCTKDGALKFRPRFFHRSSEFKAYGAGIRCLEEKKQECSSAECKTAIDDRIKAQREYQATFK